MDNSNARIYFMHNGEEVSLDVATFAGIEHDTHFNPDSEGRDALIETALKADNLRL